ncbi:hypothetical protein [Rubneribacter badeniensis]|uniref:hypothetical protein n=1 Tax=Rubneribacter badeniensis TaxID=2070688 RepID=UPI003A9175B5
MIEHARAAKGAKSAKSARAARVATGAEVRGADRRLGEVVRGGAVRLRDRAVDNGDRAIERARIVQTASCKQLQAASGVLRRSARLRPSRESMAL